MQFTAPTLAFGDTAIIRQAAALAIDFVDLGTAQVDSRLLALFPAKLLFNTTTRFAAEQNAARSPARGLG